MDRRTAAFLLTIVVLGGIGVYLAFSGGNPATDTNQVEGTVNTVANSNVSMGNRIVNASANANGTSDVNATASGNTNAGAINTNVALAQTFTEQRSAHFVRSEPANNAVLGAVPGRVTLYLDSVLDPSSTVSVSAGGEPLVVGLPTLSSDRRSMSVPLTDTPGSGPYSVSYRACWPDGSCDDGAFGFTVP